MTTNKQKKRKNYLTLPGKRKKGRDYRSISRALTNAGYKCNHATARNHYMYAVEDMLSYLNERFSEEPLTKKQIKAAARLPEIHEALEDVVYTAYQELLREEEGKDGNYENQNY